jgi:hypothetical protein
LFRSRPTAGATTDDERLSDWTHFPVVNAVRPSALPFVIDDRATERQEQPMDLGLSRMPEDGRGRRPSSPIPTT